MCVGPGLLTWKPKALAGLAPTGGFPEAPVNLRGLSKQHSMGVTRWVQGHLCLLSANHPQGLCLQVVGWVWRTQGEPAASGPCSAGCFAHSWDRTGAIEGSALRGMPSHESEV